MKNPGEETIWQNETKVDRKSGEEFSSYWNTRWRNYSAG
jgi:hypothetical protein